MQLEATLDLFSIYPLCCRVGTTLGWLKEPSVHRDEELFVLSQPAKRLPGSREGRWGRRSAGSNFVYMCAHLWRSILCSDLLPWPRIKADMLHTTGPCKGHWQGPPRVHVHTMQAHKMQLTHAGKAPKHTWAQSDRRKRTKVTSCKQKK